jgi:plasmid stabilization system protein ParE
MARLAWTAEAENWLRDIYYFIANDNPPAARRIVEGIRAKARLLMEFPELGSRYEHAQNRDIRILIYGHYRIAYLIKSDKDIDILGVFHAALDIEQYLQ